MWLWSQLLGRLRKEDHPSLGLWDQLGQHGETCFKSKAGHLKAVLDYLKEGGIKSQGHSVNKYNQQTFNCL